MATPRLGGVHGGEDIATSLANVNRELEKAYQWLTKIGQASGKVKVPTIGSGGVGTASNFLTNSQANVPAVPTSATGSAGQMVNPANVQFGQIPSWMKVVGVGMGLAKVTAMGAMGVLAAGRGFLPETEDAVAMQSMLHQMGTRQNVYGGLSTQRNILNNVMGSINQYAVGGRDQPMMAAFTMSSAGIQNQGMLRTLLSQNQGLSLMTQLPNSSVAAAQVGFSSGPFAARALSFGIPVASISTGNMKGTQQILETMYNRMMVRGIKPTPENIQESYLRGSVGANFRALGMSDEQQQIALQYFTERSRSNGPVNLSNLNGLKKAGYNEDNNAAMAEWEKNRSQLTLMSKTYEAQAEGAKEANHWLTKMNETIAGLPTKELEFFAKQTAKFETLLKDNGVATAVGVLTGALSGLVGLLGTVAGSLLLLKGGLKGVEKIAGSATGSVGALSGGLGSLLAPIGGILALTGAQHYTDSQANRTGGTKTPQGRLWTSANYNLKHIGGMFVPIPVQEKIDAVGDSLKRGLLGKAKKAWDWLNTPASSVQSGGDGTSIVNGGASPLQSMNVSTAWHKPGSWAAGYHTGVDLSASTGTKVMSVTSGRVVEASGGGRYGGAYGNHVVVKTGGREFLYAHLNSIAVSRGDQVNEGQRLGKSGNTGRSFGPHLHFEVRKGPFNYGDDVDPMPYLKGRGALGEGGGGGGASGQAVVEYAKKFIGTPYVSGGRSPKGWDCAGFTWYVYKHFGKEIGQVSEAQLKAGSKVNGVKNARPGDLFIWRRKGTRGAGADGHVAMYVGGNRVIHAHGGAGGTTNITPLSAAVPASHYLAGIRRIVSGTGGMGSGADLTSLLGSGTPEANATAGSNGLLSVDVASSGGMTVSTRSLTESFGGGAAAATTGAGNGVVGQIGSSDRGVGGGGVRASGGGNKAQVWNMLMDEGFTKQAAAGVIGNLMQESGVNPNSNQGGGGPGRGIMQWTVNERWASMQKWAKSKGLQARSLDTQVQWMLKEMKDYGVFNKMRGMDDVQDATLYFENTMERASVSNMANRYKYAREALQQFGRGGYSSGAYNVANDEDARIHANEMILTSQQAAAVRKETANILAGQKSGGHTFHINVPPGTTEEQAQMIARRVLSLIDDRSTTKSLMEV